MENSMETQESMLTTEDVANYLKVDVVTVRRLVNRGQLAAYRVGAEFRFTHQDLQDYLKRQYVPSDPPALPALADRRLGPFFMLYEIYGRFAKKGGAPAKPSIGERFTERARAALEQAQAAADEQRCGRIYASHLLLGLSVESGGLAGRALLELGITSEKIRQVLAEHPELTGPARDAADCLSIDAEVKSALESAVQQAKRLSHDFVGTEHLLLGLLSAASNNKAGAVLAQLTVPPDDVRSKVHDLILRADS
jgi:excisionase family DNA binding protein